MTWLGTTLLAIAAAVMTAFATSLAVEPLKMWLYRKKHVEERRFFLQVDWLPKYIEALNWASSACINVNGYWQAKNVEPFHYAGIAAQKLMEARNIGISTSRFFERDGLRKTILDFGSVLKSAYDRYMMLINAVTPLPDKPTDEIRAIFTDADRDITAHEDAMKSKMDELLGLGA